MLPFKTRRTSQPQGAVQLDLTCTLLQGAVFVSVGGVAVDLVTGELGAQTAASGSKVFGKGVYKAFGGSSYDSYADMDSRDVVGALTIAGVFKVPTAAEAVIVSKGSPAASVNLPFALYYEPTSSGLNGFYFVRAGAFYEAKKPSTNLDAATAETVFCVVSSGSSTASAATFYSNGNKSAGVLVGKSGTSSVAGNSGALTVGNSVAKNPINIGLLVITSVPWTDADYASFYANPWRLFKPVSRSLWTPGTVSGGAATVIPIGQQATGSVGTPTATGAANTLPSGVSASSAVGTPIAVGGSAIPATVTPAGVSATGSVGTATATGQAKAYPSGVSAIASVGSAVAVGQARAYPSGVSASTGVGTPVAVAGGAAIATPSGVQAVGAVGNLIATGQAWRVASGVSATGTAGTPVVLAGGSAIATPDGLQAVGSTGTPVATGACRTYPLGLAGYWSVGTPIAVPGVSGVVVAYPSGVQVSGYVGAPAAKGAAVALAQGVYATGQVGFPVAGLISIMPPGHVKFIPDTAAYAFVPGTTTYFFEVNT